MGRPAFPPRPDLTRILRVEQQLTRQVEELAALARLGASSVALRPEPIAVASIFSDIIEARDHALAARDLRYDVSTPAGLLIWADREKTAQILGHLLDNAIRFTPEGGQLRLDAAAASGGVAITVADSGPGIPPCIRTRLCRPVIEMEAFAGRDGHRAGDGAVLGLSLSCSLARAMGGDLLVNDPASGASVTLYLPGCETPA